MKEYYKNYINHIYQGLCDSTYHINQVQANSEIFFEKLNNILLKVQRNNGRLFFFGNGASASFSNHMALDWSKNGGILALCLSDSAMLTALANDYDYESSFLEFLKINSPTNDDFVITTSSSGNSLNIVKVLEFCNKNKIGTLALSGLNNNNKSMKMSEFSLFVPLKTYGMVECIHQVFHHLVLDRFMKIEEWNKIESQNMDSSNYKI